MILANNYLSQGYLAQGYQAQDTGIDYTVPAPPASSLAWERQRLDDNVEWDQEESIGTP